MFRVPKMRVNFRTGFLHLSKWHGDFDGDRADSVVRPGRTDAPAAFSPPTLEHGTRFHIPTSSFMSFSNAAWFPVDKSFASVVTFIPYMSLLLMLL